MIYADNNATAPLDHVAWQAMQPFFLEHFMNPSSPYTPARRAAKAIEDARSKVAALMYCEPECVAFTSGGTESNSWAIHLARRMFPKRRRWICSAVEHASVLTALDALRKEGDEVLQISVDRNGVLDLEEFERLLTPDTALVSVMLANNETGILHPVREIAEMARKRGVLVHTDASQAVGRIPVSFRELGVDLLTSCAHKMHGPKGIGALVIREGLSVEPLMRGGDQERGRRAGTENVPAIVGFGVAAEQAMEAVARPSTDLRDLVEDTLRKHLPDAMIVGAASPRLPNTTLCLVPGINTDVLIAALDQKGICVSSGSACASGSSEPSHVLRSMGWEFDDQVATLRISWGRFNNSQEAVALADVLCHTVDTLRRTSPRVEKFKYSYNP